ncbi:MAG TPA: response regulator [Allosphingosinicella sp.]|jgi:PAS domain S-box-containing protein
MGSDAREAEARAGLPGAAVHGAAALAQDWATTPLGAAARWPQPLRTAVAIALGSNIPMMVAWGPDLLVLHNDSYGEMLGDRRPALGRPLREIWADVWDVVGANARKVLAGETVYMESEPRPLRRRGEERTALLTACYNPLYDDRGEVAGIIGIVTAVSENERTAHKLRESEDRFQRIADSAPVPMWVTKLDRKRGFVNRAYAAFLGVPYDEALDFDWRTRIHPDDIGRIVAESLAGEATLQPFTLEGRYLRGDGEWRWLRSESQPRWGPAGEHEGFIGVAFDITEAKLAEAALRGMNETLEGRVERRTADLSEALERLRAEVAERERAEEALRQAQKMEAVGQLTGGIAHDFNNLLTPILGGLELIANRVDDVRVKRVAEAALESARRGAKLTSQLLAFSRIQRLAMKPIEVNAVIANMRQILKHTIGPAIEIRTDLDETAGRAICDENQLENAILNLAINARDAMADGGVLTISTRCTEEPARPDLEAGDYVCISVEDNGHGMAPDVLARAIEPFFSTKPLGKGTGLGLAQVYGIAQQSGGTLRIESDEGKGTKVQIILPRSRGAGPAAGQEPGRSAGAGAPRAKRARILVVDDDCDVRSFLADVLDDLGHEVAACDCGEAALAEVARDCPDLLLLDFAMPGMNGAEVAKAVRARCPQLPIVFVTGYAESEQLEAALGTDVKVLRKPFSVDDLAAAIAENASV